MLYYDTGIILKLYTNETESSRIRSFIITRSQPIHIHSLHRSEIISAVRLKVFRKELPESAATNCINDVEDDIHTGVLRLLEVDWSYVWRLCRTMADAHAATTGCRTLDTLHIACARSLAYRSLVTNDQRQMRMAKQVGMQVINPLD